MCLTSLSAVSGLTYNGTFAGEISFLSSMTMYPEGSGAWGESWHQSPVRILTKSGTCVRPVGKLALLEAHHEEDKE